MVGSKWLGSEVMLPNITNRLPVLIRFWRHTPFCNWYILVAVQANASCRFCEKDCNMIGEESIVPVHYQHLPRRSSVPTVFIHNLFTKYIRILISKVCLPNKSP